MTRRGDIEVTDLADVNLGPWQPQERRWKFGLARLQGVEIVSLHVDGRTADSAEWMSAEASILWRGDPLEEPDRAYVTVRSSPAPGRKLSDGKLALIGVVVTALAGLGGATITSSASQCPDQLKNASGDLARSENRSAQCTTVIGTLTRLCASEESSVPAARASLSVGSDQ